ncbi:hypothetical protein WJX79_002343 [Trebouxia sp. C0005]
MPSAWSYFVVCHLLLFATPEISVSGHISPELVGLDALPVGRGTGWDFQQLEDLQALQSIRWCGANGA